MQGAPEERPKKDQEVKAGPSSCFFHVFHGSVAQLKEISVTSRQFCYSWSYVAHRRLPAAPLMGYDGTLAGFPDVAAPLSALARGKLMLWPRVLRVFSRSQTRIRFLKWRCLEAREARR